jgi:hypothetical protein
VSRARKVQKFLSQPMYVAEVFTGLPGMTTPVEETVDSFEALLNGDLDHLPEQAFSTSVAPMVTARTVEGGDISFLKAAELTVTESIDIERATEAAAAARAALASTPDDAEAVAALRRAELRLEVAGVVPT